MTDAESEQEQRTAARAGPAENVVSTACPECDVRFAMLAQRCATGWHLRCTECGWAGTGELKSEAS